MYETLYRPAYGQLKCGLGPELVYVGDNDRKVSLTKGKPPHSPEVNNVSEFRH